MPESYVSAVSIPVPPLTTNSACAVCGVLGPPVSASNVLNTLGTEESNANLSHSPELVVDEKLNPSIEYELAFILPST